VKIARGEKKMFVDKFSRVKLIRKTFVAYANAKSVIKELERNGNCAKIIS
jgi:hypothetical protein